MGGTAEVTAVAGALRQRRRRRIALLLAVVAVLVALCIARSLDGETPHYADIREHFIDSDRHVDKGSDASAVCISCR